MLCFPLETTSPNCISVVPSSLHGGMTTIVCEHELSIRQSCTLDRSNTMDLHYVVWIHPIKMGSSL